MTDTTKTEALDRFEKAVARKAVLFLTYMGKAMPDEVYSEFATLRDDTIPSLRKLLSAVEAERDRLAAECEALRAATKRAQSVIERCKPLAAYGRVGTRDTEQAEFQRDMDATLEAITAAMGGKE